MIILYYIIFNSLEIQFQFFILFCRFICDRMDVGLYVTDQDDSCMKRRDVMSIYQIAGNRFIMFV